MCPRNLRNVWHVCNSTAFCTTLKMITVRLIFYRYVRKLVTTPSSEMAKGYTDTLLILQIIFISRAKFSYFVIFSASVWEGYGSKGLLYLLQMLFCSL